MQVLGQGRARWAFANVDAARSQGKERCVIDKSGHPMAPRCGQPQGETAVASQCLQRAFLLRPGIHYLNHGSFGACPKPVFRAYQRWQRELESEPVEFLGRRFSNLMSEARESLGTYVGADADDLVFVPNVTVGLNAVARSLRLAADDEVLATDHEYGALNRTWQFVCEHAGARYVQAALPEDIESREAVVNAVWDRVTSHTRVLFMSHITSPTALILPVAELVERARRAGITTVVDGAHAPGQIPLDLRSLGADFYAGNCHKWLCAPKGSAFLVARREAQEVITPLVISWGWRSDTPGPSRFVDEQEWQGTRDPAAYLSVPAAIGFQARHSWPYVQEQCHALLQAARRRIERLSGLPAICPDSLEWYRQMGAFPLPACDGAALQRALYDDYHIEVPIVQWGGRQFVRVSIQAYNTEADVSALVDALEFLLS
jgi:isopenicillin-N epimerase